MALYFRYIHEPIALCGLSARQCPGSALWGHGLALATGTVLGRVRLGWRPRCCQHLHQTEVVAAIRSWSERDGREALGLDRCRSPLAVPGRGSGVRSAPPPPVQTPRCQEGPRRGCPNSWRREPSAQPRPEALRGKPRRLNCARTPKPRRGAVWPHPRPRGHAQADRAVLARVKGDGDARVKAVCDQVLWCRLEEARKLAAAQRGIALVREDHADARGACGAHLLGVQRRGGLQWGAAGWSRLQGWLAFG
eukprot:scaffold65568_cov66-Phaeocystis_antarctica.AAC.1